MPRPDVLVGRDGELVAVRSPAGTLSAVGARRAQYELSRWLEHDGDGRSAREAENGRGFRCDGAGCAAAVKGKIVAVVRRPSALAEDCERADILVLSQPVPPACRARGIVIDLWETRDKGTHAIYIDGGSTSVVSVADVRGTRPWARGGRRPAIDVETAIARAAGSGRIGSAARAAGGPANGSTAVSGAASRLGTFAAPFGLNEQDAPTPGPDVEDREAGSGERW
jgi:competence protein ComEC